MTQWILASDGRPFRDRDAAQIKRDLLLAELGEAVQLEVIPHPSGGFAVDVRHSRSAQGESVRVAPRELALREFDTQNQAEVDVAVGREVPRSRGPEQPARLEPTAGATYPEAFRLSPAVRAFPGLHLQAVLGAMLLLGPHRVFAIIGLGLPSSTAGAVILGLTALSGALLCTVALTRFLWAVTSNTYEVDDVGVEQIQWYFDRGRLRRRAPRVNFGHLRSVDVDQSVIQMLLNVGSLRLASGATDSYEVVLQNVSAPRTLQREFQRRLQRDGMRPANEPQRDL